MKKFISLVLCGVLLIAGLPVFVQATETAENEVSLEEFTNQLSDIIEKYDNDTAVTEEEMNTVSSFSVCADEEDEKDEPSSYSTDRLIVKAEGSIDTLDAVAWAEGYNDWHILQFDNSKSAEKALEYYESCKDVEYAQEDEINRLMDFEILKSSYTDTTLHEYMVEDANTLGFTPLRKKLTDSGVNYTGQLTVAVIDTGIAYDHDLLKDRVDPNGFNAIDSTASCYDDNGHGTHVSGIIVANTFDNVTIKPYKVLNSEGRGTDAQTVLGVEAAIADGVDIINMSFGRRGDNPAMDEALAKAHRKGIKLVAAAGNDGVNMDSISYTPACCDNVITVMAFDGAMLRRVSFSNYGSMCETAAVGYMVVSSYLDNTYAMADGTSQAAPYVTAALTYLVLDNPKITYSQIVDRIDQYEWREGMYIEFILDEDIQQTPAPEFSVEPGEFDTEFYLEITCSDPEANITYLVNDSAGLNDYEEPIKIKYDTVITTYAQRKGKIKSEVIVGEYKRQFINEEDKYTISEDGNITSYKAENTPDNTEVIVPDTINGITPTAIGASVFSGYTYLEKVTLPDTVTQIGEKAFKNCSNLEYVIARNVQTVGQYAFDDCTNLKEFVNNSLKTVGNYGFADTGSLTYVHTETITSLGNCAFINSGIQSFVTENTLSLGSAAFKESSLRYAEIPNVNAILEQDFYNCTKLETAIITNSGYIRESAFYGCGALKEISSDKATSVGDSAFKDCAKLVTATFPVLKYVNKESFYNCKRLKNFTAPAVNEIAQSAFENCISLENASYQYLEKLSDYAFRGCTALRNVSLYALQTLGKDAFSGCWLLNELWINGDVTVGAGAFETDFIANKVILDNAVTIKDLPENVPVGLPVTITNIEDTDFENVIIYGSKDSFGEAWATENNQTFVEITLDNAIFGDVPEYCESTKDTLSFDVMGLNRVYQWYGNTKNSNTGGKFIKNATTSEFTPSSYTKIYDYYYCVVVCQDGSNPLMTVTSGVCTLIPVIKSLVSSTTVDLAKLSIKTTATGTNSITDLIKFGDNTTHYALPSYSNGKGKYFGTGSSVIVYLNGEADSVFNLVVYGDTNGDSVCDVLDCAEIEKAYSKQITLNGSTFAAADMNNNNKIDSRDYQNAVNKALAE